MAAGSRDLQRAFHGFLAFDIREIQFVVASLFENSRKIHL